MAKLEEIKPGRKFYQVKCKDTRDKKTNRRHTVVLTIYVIGINIETRMVLASINKQPAKWFSLMNVRYWQKENPELIGI